MCKPEEESSKVVASTELEVGAAQQAPSKHGGTLPLAVEKVD